MERATARKTMLCFLVFLLALAGVFGRTTDVKAANGTQAPSFDMTMQLNVYSIDLKTESLYSQYYHFQMWTNDPTVSGFEVVILRPDYYGGVELLSSNESGTQQVINSINSSQPDINAWRFHLNPIRPWLLATPEDQYEVSFLIAVNISTTLTFNDSSVWIPAYLQDEWAYSSDIAAQKLAAPPDNQTLNSLGLSTQKFYQYGLNTFPDFYLFTITLNYPFWSTFRMTVAFLLPSLAILAVLIVTTWKRKRLKKSDILAIFVGAGLFALTFLVSFFQYAPPDMFTWQEAFLIGDFAFASGLAIYALVKEDKSESTSRDSTAHEQSHKNTQPGQESQERRLAEIGRSLDKAFEWFVLLMTVLIGILFAFLIWVEKPEANLDLTAKFMFSLTIPLISAICIWLWHLLTLREEREISLRLISWSILSMIFAYYIMLFFTFVVFSVTQQFELTAVVAILSGNAILFFIPSRRISRAYRAITHENQFWNKQHAPTRAYLLGVFIAAFLILIPFAFP